MRVISIAALTLLSALSALSAGTVERRQNESLADFAKRILPPKTELAHPPLEGSFGPSDHNIVLLFRPADDMNTNYTGWVLTPDPAHTGSYTKYVLPPMKEVPTLFEIAVRSVIYARAAPGPRPDLIILFEYHRNGRTDSGYASYVYHWAENRFQVLDDVSARLTGLRTAAQIRQKLKNSSTDSKKDPHE